MNGWDPTVRAVSHDDFCECTFTTYCSWVVEYLWKHVSISEYLSMEMTRLILVVRVNNFTRGQLETVCSLLHQRFQERLVAMKLAELRMISATRSRQTSSVVKMKTEMESVSFSISGPSPGIFSSEQIIFSTDVL